MICGDHWFSIFHDNHGPANPAAITGDIHRTMMMVDVDTDELAYPPGAPEAAETVDETGRE